MSNLTKETVVTALELLSSLGLVRLNRISGDWYSMYCPFHNNGNEKKPAFGVLLVAQHRNGQSYPIGFSHCFACGYAKSFSEMITDLLSARNIAQSGLEWLAANIPGFEPDDEFERLMPEDLMTTLIDKYAVNNLQKLLNPTPVQHVSEEELASYRFTVPYMYSRGLTDELIERYDIGFDPNHVPPGRKKPLPCITFPVRDAQGKTLFFCRRSIEGKYFNYPMGVTKPVYGIYELDPRAKRVIICESAFNTLTAVKYGDAAVGLLGTGNAYQIQQLKELGVTEFITAFDPDEAGRKATEKLRRALRNVAIVRSFVNIPEGKDINDLDYDTYKSLEID